MTISSVGARSHVPPIDQAADSRAHGVTGFHEFRPPESKPRPVEPRVPDIHTPEPVRPNDSGAATFKPEPAKPEQGGSKWPEGYALPEIPKNYRISGTPGVLVNSDGGSEFVVHDNRAYSVSRDPQTGQYSLSGPRDPSHPSYPIRIDSDGHWENGAQSTGERPATASGLPPAYIAEPRGKLQPDSKVPGLSVDEHGQRFLQSGGNHYGVRYDNDNQTWRVIQPDQPTKPGIPVKPDPDGTWRTHSEVGGPAGNPAIPGVDEAQERLRLHSEQSRYQNVLHDLLNLQQQVHQDIHDFDRQRQEFEQHILQMESTGLPEEIWGPLLPQARSGLQQAQQHLAAGRQRLQEILQLQQQAQQQLQQVEQQLQQLQ